MRFAIMKDLIYYEDPIDGKQRLCIPKKLKKDIFQLAYDEHFHSGFKRTYQRIVNGLFIKNLTSRPNRDTSNPVSHDNDGLHN